MTSLQKEITVVQAKKRTADHKAALADLKTGRVKLLRAVAKSIDLGVYKILGFSNQDDWLETIFEESVSHVRRLLHNVKALQKVPTAQLQTICEGNAYLLARLPEKARTKALIEKAAVEKPAEFRETLAKAYRNGHAGPPAAPWGTFAVRLPPDALIVVNEAVAKLGRLLQVDLESSEARPKGMITVMIAWATLVTTTDESRLNTEIQGGEGVDA